MLTMPQQRESTTCIHSNTTEEDVELSCTVHLAASDVSLTNGCSRFRPGSERNLFVSTDLLTQSIASVPLLGGVYWPCASLGAIETCACKGKQAMVGTPTPVLKRLALLLGRVNGCDCRRFAGRWVARGSYVSTQAFPVGSSGQQDSVGLPANNVTCFFGLSYWRPCVPEFSRAPRCSSGHPFQSVNHTTASYTRES